MKYKIFVTLLCGLILSVNLSAQELSGNLSLDGRIAFEKVRRRR